ncbi:uncharacterized protein BKA78DRAFT_363487 [Phyllosticta capitalensis]|uniref:uncharacterized protein n=1 Tax=Phyllosticta capitalensis TaxID=121624 RepID=UPI0031323579
MDAAELIRLFHKWSSANKDKDEGNFRGIESELDTELMEELHVEVGKDGWLVKKVGQNILEDQAGRKKKQAGREKKNKQAATATNGQTLARATRELTRRGKIHHGIERSEHGMAGTMNRFPRKREEEDAQKSWVKVKRARLNQNMSQDWSYDESWRAEEDKQADEVEKLVQSLTCRCGETTSKDEMEMLKDEPFDARKVVEVVARIITADDPIAVPCESHLVRMAHGLHYILPAQVLERAPNSMDVLKSLVLFLELWRVRQIPFPIPDKKELVKMTHFINSVAEIEKMQPSWKENGALHVTDGRLGGWLGWNPAGKGDCLRDVLLNELEEGFKQELSPFRELQSDNAMSYALSDCHYARQSPMSWAVATSPEVWKTMVIAHGRGDFDFTWVPTPLQSAHIEMRHHVTAPISLSNGVFNDTVIQALVPLDYPVDVRVVSGSMFQSWLKIMAEDPDSNRCRVTTNLTDRGIQETYETTVQKSTLLVLKPNTTWRYNELADDGTVFHLVYARQRGDRHLCYDSVYGLRDGLRDYNGGFPLTQAITGNMSWENPLVLEIVEMAFADDQTKWDEYVREWKKQTYNELVREVTRPRLPIRYELKAVDPEDSIVYGELE